MARRVWRPHPEGVTFRGTMFPFDEKAGPSVADVHQGDGGDCTLLAAAIVIIAGGSR